jgi:flagellar protein FliL
VFKLGGSKKKIVIIAGLVILLGGGGAGAYLLIGKKTAAKSSKQEKTVGEQIVDDATAGAKAAEAEDSEKQGEGKEEEKASEAEEGHGEKKGEEKAPKKVSKRDLFYSFEKNFTVNLLDAKGRWFFQGAIQIEAASLKGIAEIEDNDAPLRDATIMMISSKKPAEIQTPEGKEQLRRELLTRYGGIVDPKALKEVYFTEFAVAYR